VNEGGGTPKETITKRLAPSGLLQQTKKQKMKILGGEGLHSERLTQNLRGKKSEYVLHSEKKEKG